MKRLLPSVLFFLFIFKLSAQTNVSGGIFSNTTWTKPNSPYIVIDTVVVFPGVKLTIDPGVTVKYNLNKQIEVRNTATISAMGLASDSIRFTSNVGSPTAGKYDGIYLNQGNASFNFCSFKYGSRPIYASGGSVEKLDVKNSSFFSNIVGIGWIYYTRTTIDSCNFKYNNYGIKGYVPGFFHLSNSSFTQNQNGVYQVEHAIIMNCNIQNNSQTGVYTYQADSIYNCTIKTNSVGVEVYSSGGGSQIHINKSTIDNNQYGIIYGSFMTTEDITCNRICGNSAYNFKHTTNSNIAIPNNYWCTNTASLIASGVYDAYDNVSLGIVNYTPFDTTQCYLLTGISSDHLLNSKASVKLYPNPNSGSFYFAINSNGEFESAELTISTGLGQIIQQTSVSDGLNAIKLQNLVSGVYFYTLIKDGQNTQREKFVIDK